MARRTQADVDAVTEVQLVTIRGDLPQYPFLGGTAG
jgi:transcription initiation factor TFIIIB Brf1 subunit/transcription initiation factor TFIIB